MQWDTDANKHQTHIRCRELTGNGVHTFIGMLGYCSKDKDEPWYQCVYKDVSAEDLEQGLQEYLEYGAVSKSKTFFLSHNNIMERTYIWAKYKGRAEEPFESNVREMIRTGKYAFSGQFIAYQGSFIGSRTEALWRTYTDHKSITNQDVCRVLYAKDSEGLVQRLRYWQGVDVGAPGPPGPAANHEPMDVYDADGNPLDYIPLDQAPESLHW